MLFYKLESEQGVATLIALVIMGMLLLIGLAAVNTSEDEITIAGNELQEMRAFYAAESGLERASAYMNTEFDKTGRPPAIMPYGSSDINGCVVTFSTFDTANGGKAVQRVLSSGALTGLHASVNQYTLQSVAISEVENAKVSLAQNFETVLIPIFQFAVFFENDLWTTPLYDMTIDGRVHVNGNMYLQAFKGLDFTSRVTASGGIFHGLANGQHSGANANVNFTNPSGNLVTMKQGGGWLDNSDGDWRDSALGRWGGVVQDEAFGQKELNLPLSDDDDAHKMIERGAGNSDSYENKADFKIIDGVPYSRNSGSWVNVSGFLPGGTITNVQFEDDREGEEVNATQVDIDLLRTSGYMPINGVIYSSDQSGGMYNGLKLVNGDEIGNPLSIFSENPVYVQGNFNTTNKQPVAVAGDVITFLSNSWSDANSYKSLSNRKPTATTVNLAMLTGDDTPTGSNYGGGLENLPRFLEDWKSKKFTMRGSMINLWRTQQAGGDWSYGSYYTAPSRDWGFDTDFEDPNKLPPETPVVRFFQSTGWVQQYVGTLN